MAWTVEQQQAVEHLQAKRDEAARELADEASVYKAAKEKLAMADEAVFEAIREIKTGQTTMDFDGDE